MRTIGLLGGMSWQSSATYYSVVNEEVARRLGGLHSARVVLVSVDFDGIARLQREGAWFEAAVVLAAAARDVEAAGADLLLLCTNTMHKVADQIAAAIRIPLLHIADATGRRLVADGRRRVGLLGTRYTMEQSFYRQRLEDRFGLEVLTPAVADREHLDRVIFDELCVGIVEDRSRAAVAAMVERFVADGADAVILGCTELGLLLDPATSGTPLYDTTRIHAEVAVDLALASGPVPDGPSTDGPQGPPPSLADRVELALASWEQVAPARAEPMPPLPSDDRFGSASSPD